MVAKELVESVVELGGDSAAWFFFAAVRHNMGEGRVSAGRLFFSDSTTVWEGRY